MYKRLLKTVMSVLLCMNVFSYDAMAEETELTEEQTEEANQKEVLPDTENTVSDSEGTEDIVLSEEIKENTETGEDTVSDVSDNHESVQEDMTGLKEEGTDTPDYTETAEPAEEETPSEPVIEHVSAEWINPDYIGTIENPVPDARPRLKAVRSTAAAEFSSEEEAGAYIREQMKARNTSITFTYTFPSGYDEAIVSSIWQKAYAHTGNPTEGDYLRYQNNGYSMTGSGGGNRFTMMFTTSYYTTAAQEAEMDSRCASVISSLALDNLSDEQKIRAIHDYIVNNVTYDNEHLGDESYKLQFTAYAALINGTAVCQGYALLTYRLMLMAGIDCRIITGEADNGQAREGHAWNIVGLDDYYYFIDTTWDDGSHSDNYYMKTSFSDHFIDEEKFPASFFVEYPIAQIIDSGECGYDVYWKLFSSGELKIYGTGNMYSYNRNTNPAPWQAHRAEITSVSIGEEVTNIGNYAFYSCTSLPGITVPGNVTYIGEGAFYSCTSLTDVTLQNGLTGIGYYAFYNCAALQNISIPEGAVAIRNSAFRNCTSLIGVSIPASVTSIGSYAFDGCGSLQTVYYPSCIGDWNNIAIEAGNNNLTNADISYEGNTIGEWHWADDYSTAAADILCTKHNKVEKTIDAAITSETVPAACTEAGSSTYTGTVVFNGAQYTDTQTVTIPASGHAWGEWTVTKTATCTETGEEKRTCANDVNHAETRTVAALGHVLTKTQAKAATFEEAGNTEYWTCTRCGKHYSDAQGTHEIEEGSWIIPATGYVYKEPVYTWSADNSTATAIAECENDTTHTIRETVNTTAVTTPATCEGAGKTVYTAAFTNELFTVQNKEVTIPATGHTWGEWTVTKAATCTEAGEETRICANDGTHKETRTIQALGHDWDEGVVTKQPTTTETGIRTYTCKHDSNHTKTEVIPKLPPVMAESITLSKIAENLIKGKTVQLTATVKPDNTTDKTVTWTTSDKNTATVDKNGKVTAVKTGTATITAKTVNGKTATCKITVTNPATGISLNKTTGNLTKGGILQLTATVTPSDADNKTVTWTSSDTKIVTVDTAGKVTAVKTGTATITAKTVNGKTATCKITVTNPATGISLNKTTGNLTKGSTLQLTATVSPSDADNKTVTWTSSDTKIVTVDTAGKVTAVKSGTATITAKTVNGKTATCKITVTNPATGISLNKTTGTLTKGGTLQLTATVSPSDADNKTVTWTTSDRNIATVDTAGKVTAVKTGTATITAKTVNGKTATCKVTVTNPATGISLNKTTGTLTKGGTLQLTATVTPSDADNKTVTWTTSDKNIATVDQNGKVTAIKTGAATITAKTANGKTATCKVTVTNPATGISLNKTSASLETGKTLALTATVSPSDAANKTVAWSSNNTKVATVDQNGKVTAVKAGTATITAKTVNGKTATCKVTVSDPVPSDPVVAFVTRLYKLCLNRDPDQGGLNDWVNQLKTGKKNAAQVVYGFFFSDEMKRLNLSNEDYVERCYAVMMDRASDAGGKAYWVERLENGVTRLYVVRGFVESQEFTKICKDYGVTRGSLQLTDPRDQNYGITSFVARCYTKALGRQYDEGGLKNWCNQILYASNRKQAAIDTASTGFFHSTEFRNKGLSNTEYVKVLYRTFLGREYDVAGLNDWVGQLNRGASRDKVMNGFAYSQEFNKIMASYGIK